MCVKSYKKLQILKNIKIIFATKMVIIIREKSAAVVNFNLIVLYDIIHVKTKMPVVRNCKKFKEVMTMIKSNILTIFYNNFLHKTI